MAMDKGKPELESSEISTKEDHGPHNPIISLISNVLTFIESARGGRKREAASEAEESEEKGPTGAEASMPQTMTFAVRRKPIASLRFEAEDRQSTSPAVLWQVYAFGGLMVLRWAWIRWQERTSKNDASDDEPSRNDD